MTNFLNSKIGLSYLQGVVSEHILGRTYPVRAQTTLDYYEPPYPAEVAGSALVLTEVVPWPWSEDDEGVAFDQANLYGVRTACWRQPLADGGGDKDDWVAVPRSLPSGYTAVGRCGILVPGLYAGYLDGITPDTYATWNHRTHTGLLWDTSDPEQAARASWSPMNRNQTTLHVGSSWQSIVVAPGVDPWTYYPYSGITSSHVGFRGAKVTVSYVNPNIGPYPLTVSRTVKVAYQKITDDAWVADAKPATVHDVATLTLSYTFSGAGFDHTEDIDLGSMLPADDGIPCRFFFYAEPLGSLALPEWLIYIGLDCYFGPRTDVPLWYFASMGNRCAPGGIILP
jgi:hypothetical protein